MSTNDLTACEKRGYTQHAGTVEAQSEGIQPPAKRLKTSTMEPVNDSTIPSVQPPTLHKVSQLENSKITVKPEIIIITDEADVDEIIVADEPEKADTRPHGDDIETPQKQPMTLSSIEALELAEKFVDQYAGPYTRQLEQKLKDCSGMVLFQHKPSCIF